MGHQVKIVGHISLVLVFAFPKESEFRLGRSQYRNAVASGHSRHDILRYNPTLPPCGTDRVQQ